MYYKSYFFRNLRTDRQGSILYQVVLYFGGEGGRGVDEVDLSPFKDET